MLIIEANDYCGIAYLGPVVHKMFSVVWRKCATGYYSFAHEIVHNLGCNHDRGTKNTCGGSGYSAPAKPISTIVANMY